MTEAKSPVSFSYKFSELKITENKVLEIMGYEDLNNTPEPLIESLNYIFTIAEDFCNIRGGYVITDDLNIDRENKRIFSHNNWFETKQIVTHQLRKSEQAAWFVCTAGEELTNYSKQLTEEGDSIGSYSVDVLSNIIVDKAMDFIQSELKTETAKQGLNITNRYSPGYCDWNIAEQKKLFQAFPKNFMDVSLTDSCLMLPIKSISGIIGIGKAVHYNNYTCNLCSDVTCFYRNKGAHR